jgi:methyltransferase (TIGR00027 family)
VDQDTPSRTAYLVAIRRAAHQIVDIPLVLTDPLALRIIGADGEAWLRKHLDREESRVARALRALMAARSRFAEDALGHAFEQGVRQYVVLGAGLDTFAYRHGLGQTLRVFEVDHPATQEWKRHQLEKAGIAAPSSLTFTPVDFERQAIVKRLVDSGFNRTAPAFFAWLGVTMYLARETVMATLEMIASLPKPSGVVFDYGIDRSLLGPLERIALTAFEQRVAAIGEPWTTYFIPAQLADDLRARGFQEIEDLSPEDINARYFHGRFDGLKVGTTARLMRAST